MVSRSFRLLLVSSGNSATRTEPKMSAFMCCDAHFDALAYYCAQHRVTIRARAGTKAFAQAWEIFQNDSPNLAVQQDRVGAILRDENARSVEERYHDCKTSNAMGTKNAYRYRPVSKPLSHTAALQAVRCYEYQACETSDFDETLAHAICEAITATAIRALTEGEKWGLSEEDVRHTDEELKALRAKAMLRT